MQPRHSIEYCIYLHRATDYKTAVPATICCALQAELLANGSQSDGTCSLDAPVGLYYNDVWMYDLACTAPCTTGWQMKHKGKQQLQQRHLLPLTLQLSFLAAIVAVAAHRVPALVLSIENSCSTSTCLAIMEAAQAACLAHAACYTAHSKN
jgi:hypothetical protein